MGCAGSKDPTSFRGGSYHKAVCCGRRRVKKGECCAIWDQEGDYSLTEGPARIWIYNSDVKFLDRFVADQGQYLRITYRDGRKEHMRGPCSVFMDPVLHTDIQVKDAICLDAFEAVIVYSESARSLDGIVLTGPSILDTSPLEVQMDPTVGLGPVSKEPVVSGVQRRVVQGPTLFIPSANEWLHEFLWHGNDPDDKGRLIKGRLKFTKLKTVPAQLYYNISDVRTQDDALLKIKLMMFYHINDVSMMLDATSDPIGDFSNAVCADVIRFASDFSFEDFLQQIDKLNHLESFPVLAQRANAIGFTIDKVVFRGYKASDHLQKVYDHAIQTRAEMRLKAEEAEQEEAATDLKLAKKLERAEKERELQLAEANHRIEVQSVAHQHDLQVQRETSQLHIESQRLQMAEQLHHMQNLAELGAHVDLTKVIVSQNQRDSQVIRVEHAADETSTHVHCGTTI